MGKMVEEADHTAEIDVNPQGALALGSEAADIQHLSHAQLPMPGLGRRSTSPHAISAYQQVAQQIEEERKQQEEIVRKQRVQMEEMHKRFDAETRRKELL